MSKSDSEIIDNNVDFGSILVAARQAKSYSVDDVSRHLKIPHQVIEAIESNDVEALPPATFTQGYLRAYAKFLEIPEEEVLEAYNLAIPRETKANLKLRSSHLNKSSSQSPLFKAITMLLVVSGVAAVIFGGFQYYQEKVDDMETQLEGRQDSFTGHSLDSPGSRELDIRQNARLTSDDKLILESVDSTGSSDEMNVVDGGKSPSNWQMSMSDALDETAEVQEVMPPEVDSIVIIAEKGSWAHVRDATDKRLFKGMVPVGGKRKLEGEAPFRISLGNARSTKVLINDLEVDMTGRITRKNISNFTVSTKEETVFFH